MASAARLSPHRVFGYYCRRVPAPIKENNNGDKKMNQAHGKWIVATLLGSIWLSGCGGGGGGGATITSSPTGVGYDGPTEPVAMSDQAAAEPIAAATIATAINLDLGTLPALQATDNAPSLLDLADITKGMIKRSQSLAATADGAALAGVTQSDTFDCGASGTVTVTQTAADPAAATPGDTITLVFNSCNDGFGYVTSGSFGMVLLVYTDSFNMSVKVNYGNFKQTSTSSSDYFLLNGGFTMALSENTSTSEDVIAITGDALLAEESFGGVVSQEALSQFSLVDSYNWSNDTFATDRDFTFYSTDIGGSLTVETTTPFVIASGNAYPSAGQLVITGAGNAKVRVTAQSDATNVFIEYDVAPADGTYESNQTVTWSYLASL
jgi:hypothetical protein